MALIGGAAERRQDPQHASGPTPPPTHPHINQHSLPDKKTFISFVCTAAGLFQDNVYCHLASGLGAGFFAVCIGSPVDVVKSRMMGEAALGAACCPVPPGQQLACSVGARAAVGLLTRDMLGSLRCTSNMCAGMTPGTCHGVQLC